MMDFIFMSPQTQRLASQTLLKRSRSMYSVPTKDTLAQHAFSANKRYPAPNDTVATDSKIEGPLKRERHAVVCNTRYCEAMQGRCCQICIATEITVTTASLSANPSLPATAVLTGREVSH